MNNLVRRSRWAAFRVFLLASLVLFFGSLAVPDEVLIWGETRPLKWQRSVVSLWSEPLQKLSLRLPTNKVRTWFEEIIEESPSSSAVFSPARRPESNSSSSGSSNVELVATRLGTEIEPLKILAVGDSLMLDLQRGMERILGSRSDVLIEGRGALGFGFVVPYWDWDDDVLPDYDQMIANIDPDVVVMMIGANEFQGHVIEGEELRPGSNRWKEVLYGRATEAISHFLARGARLYWWSTPAMSDPSYLVSELNKIWELAVGEWKPWTKTIESMKTLGDDNGDFRWYLEKEDGKLVALRKEHGVHFHEIGADLLALQFENVLVEDGWLRVRD